MDSQKEKTYTEAELIEFGKFLLSKEREELVFQDKKSADNLKTSISQVSDADLRNWQNMEENNSLKFNFYHFLEGNDYTKEIVRNRDNSTFCTNYQKELEINTWNCITIFPDNTYSAVSHDKSFLVVRVDQPITDQEAKELLTKIEKL